MRSGCGEKGVVGMGVLAWSTALPRWRGGGESDGARAGSGGGCFGFARAGGGRKLLLLLLTVRRVVVARGVGEGDVAGALMGVGGGKGGGGGDGGGGGCACASSGSGGDWGGGGGGGDANFETASAVGCDVHCRSLGSSTTALSLATKANVFYRSRIGVPARGNVLIIRLVVICSVRKDLRSGESGGRGRRPMGVGRSGEGDERGWMVALIGFGVALRRRKSFAVVSRRRRRNGFRVRRAWFVVDGVGGGGLVIVWLICCRVQSAKGSA